MSEGILIAVAAAVLVFVLSGAKSSAYLLYFLGFIPFITLDAQAGGLDGVTAFGQGNVLFKMTVRLTVVIGFLILLLRRRESFLQLCRVQSVPVLFFFCWALLSLTRTQSPFVSLFRLGELLAFFLGGAVIYAESSRFHGPRRVARWHCLALLQILLVALYFEEMHPELSHFVNVDGIRRMGYRLINANTLGFACVAVILWSTMELRERREGARSFFFERVMPFAAFLVAVSVLIQSRSRTAMGTVILGQTILWFPFHWRQPRRWAAFGVFLLVGAAFVVAGFDTIAEWFLRGEEASSLTTATGRTGLWKALLTEQLPRAPLLGAGYLMLGADGRFPHNGVLWSNAHNTYVFALISTGLPGFLAILAIAFTPWCVSFRRIFTTPRVDQPFWVLLFAMQTVVVVASVTGFGICGYPNPLMFFHYCLYGYTTTRLRAPRSGDAPVLASPPRQLRALTP